MINRLHQILGDKGLITDPQEMHPYLIDWRDRRKGNAVCVALPATTEEVSLTMKVAAEEGQPVFPSGKYRSVLRRCTGKPDGRKTGHRHQPATDETDPRN